MRKGLYLPEGIVDAMAFLDPDELSEFIVYLQAALNGENVEEMHISGAMQAFIITAVAAIKREEE